MEKQDNQAKIKASLLRNKNVSQAFRDAMDAPIGSTKRQKAQKLVSILRKTVTKYDGKGGPGFSPTIIAPQQFPQPSTMNAPGMVIFQAPPSPYDGKGGPGFDVLSASNPFNLATNTGPNLGATQTNPFLMGVKQPAAQSPYLTGGAAPFGSPAPSAPGAGVSVTDPTKLTIGNPMGNISYNPQVPNSTTPTQPATRPAAPLNPAPVPTEQGTAPQDGQPVEVPTDGGTPVDGTNPTGGENPAENPTPGSFSTLQKLGSDALAANTGPSSFAYGAMNDINALRELMPGVPDDQLPVGASLTGQIVDIKDALKKEYDIEGLTNRLNQKISQGSTLESDLNDFIRGKDEYLNQVDGMLTTARKSALDMSGGPDAGVMANYVDYLTTLKGRQNKRYIEFYNGAISQYNGELTALQSQLQTQTGAYEEELKDRSSIKQDDYNRIFSSLTEMYNAAEDAPRKQYELGILQSQYYTAAGDMGSDSTSAISDKWINEFGNLSNQGVFLDKDTKTFLPSVTSLEPVLEGIISNGQVNVGGGLRIIGEAIGNDLASGSQDVNAYMTKVKKYEKMLIDLKSQSMDPAIQARYGADFSPAIDNLAANLAGAAGDGISTYILQNSKKVKDAMHPLVAGSGMFGMGGKPTRDNFVKKTGSGLSADMLGRLYDYYDVINAADPSGATMKQLIAFPDDKFASTVSQGLGQTLFNGVSATQSLQGM